MITIEVWSDINCPFCYIGKRHLELALKEFKNQDEVKVEWKSFELDPFADPPKGAKNEELVAQKYGKDVSWAKKMSSNITEMAKLSGLEFNMDRVVPANSFNAHRLIHLAKTYNMADIAKEKLLAAKFIEGKDISDPGTLKTIGIEMGLDREELMRVFESDRFESDVRRDEEMAGALGIRGVPFFVFNKRIALSGAQPVEMFLQALDEAKNNHQA